MTTNVCPVCGALDATPISNISGVPVFCNVLLGDAAEAANAPVGEITLAACPDCGHIFNSEFDERLIDYSPDYENSLHFSPTFQNYATDLASRLVDTYGVRGRQVVELGCGKGDFLAMLANAGDNEAIGFDPSYDGAVDHHVGAGSVRVVNDTYEAAGSDLHPALVVSRHVLEHLTDPSMLIAGLGQWRESDPVVYLEVPDADHMIENHAYWDVIYEHPSYFTRQSLSRLCTANDLAPLRIESSFGGQYLSVTARLAAPTDLELRPAPDPETFGAGFEAAITRWAARLERLADSGRHAAIWGAGSKGVSFAALVPGADTSVALAIDLNPRKAGRYMPASAVPVTTPDDPRVMEAAVVLVMNPIYEDEIRASLEAMGSRAIVEVVT